MQYIRNNNNKVLASCNHSSSETIVEQQINVSNKSNGVKFPNPQMSANKIYNCDAHP